MENKIKNASRMAVIETQVTNLNKTVTEIQADVKSIMQTLAGQPSLEMKITQLEQEIRELKKGTNLWKWLAPTLTGFVAAIFGSVITFLVISYLNNL